MMESKDRWGSSTKYWMVLMESKVACGHHPWTQIVHRARLAASAQLLAAILEEPHHDRQRTDGEIEIEDTDS
jgi:hypothetical protein